MVSLSNNVSKGASSPAPVASASPVGAVVMPPVDVATQNYNNNMRMLSQELTLPKAHISEGSTASHQGEAHGPSQSLQTAPLQLHGWEVNNGPVSQIMRAVGTAIVAILKILTPKKPI